MECYYTFIVCNCYNLYFRCNFGWFGFFSIKKTNNRGFWKEKLNNLINASTVVEEQSKKLYEQKKNGQFNPYLDQGLSDFVDTLSKSNYVLDPKLGKFRI